MQALFLFRPGCNARAPMKFLSRDAIVFVAVSAVLVWPSMASAQWLKHPTAGIPRTADGRPNLSAPAPRTADGRPELSGLWEARDTIESDFKPADAMPW